MNIIFIKTDTVGSIKADKEKNRCAVASIMVLDRAIRCGNQNTESVTIADEFYLCKYRVLEIY